MSGINPRASLSRIELIQLRYAVTAADYGSFRKAAEVLNVEQSTLSRSVSRLEHATSIIIFNRSPAGVTLSPSGCKIIQRARVVLQQLEQFGSETEQSTLGVHKLCVGFCTSLSAGNLRVAILDFRRKFNDTRVKTLERPRSRLAVALQNGSLDVIVSTGKLATTQCESQTLWSERILIGLPASHRLAARERVYWTDLRDETLLMSRHDPYCEFEDLVTSKLTAAELRPSLEHHDVSRSILKSLISMQFGLALLLESDIGVKVPDIVFKELEDGSGPTRVGFSAFWVKSNSNPALAGFVKMLKERYPSLSS